MHVRIYPSRCNTIFKNSTGEPILTSGNVNTGKSSIFQLMDGNGYSTIMMNFEIIQKLSDILKKYDYTCSLKLWDAGTIFQPVINLKPIDLLYTLLSFSEGDGFSYLAQDAVSGVSNWNLRDSSNPWPVFGAPGTGLFPAMHLNEVSEDIVILNLKSFIDDAVTQGIDPNFGIRLSSNTVQSNTLNKFLYGRRTRTIFKPYLEFIINDTIQDDRYDCVATKSNTLYLLNESGEDFVGTVTCEVLDQRKHLLISSSVQHLSTGVYSINFTPDISLSNEIVHDIWSIDGEVVTKHLIQVQSPNQISKRDLSNLYFYPTFSYQHNTVRQDDVVRVNIISEIRSVGSVLSKNYEYRVVATNDFEMIPWSPVSLYDSKMFCFIDTSYFFQDMEYEIFVRCKSLKTIKTSPLSLRFRLQANGATHLDGFGANPYNSRNYYSGQNR